MFRITLVYFFDGYQVRLVALVQHLKRKIKRSYCECKLIIKVVNYYLQKHLFFLVSFNTLPFLK